MVPRRPPVAGPLRRVEGARMPALTADPVQVETLTPPGWHGLRYAAPSGMDP